MLRDNQQASDNNEYNVHPVTGSDTYMCLFDRFHERNTSSEIDVLRRITCIPELNSLLNTQVEEQLHLRFESSKHFLNKMQPVNHIYLLRSIIINHYNNGKNNLFTEKLKNKLHLQLGQDLFGRLVFLNKTIDHVVYDTDVDMNVKDETGSIASEHEIISDVSASNANSPARDVVSVSETNASHDISNDIASEEEIEVKTETERPDAGIKKSERKVFKRKCQCCEGDDDTEIAQTECKKKKETDFEICPQNLNTNLSKTWILDLGLSIREKHTILSGQCLHAKIIGAAMRRIQYLNSWYYGLEPIVNKESIWQRCYKRQKGQVIQILNLYQPRSQRLLS